MFFKIPSCISRCLFAQVWIITVPKPSLKIGRFSLFSPCLDPFCPCLDPSVGFLSKIEWFEGTLTGLMLLLLTLLRTALWDEPYTRCHGNTKNNINNFFERFHDLDWFGVLFCCKCGASTTLSTLYLYIITLYTTKVKPNTWHFHSTP